MSEFINSCAVNIMKMGKIEPRGGNAYTVTSYLVSCLIGQCRLLYSSPWNCKPSNAYKYLHISGDLAYAYTGQV